VPLCFIGSRRENRGQSAGRDLPRGEPNQVRAAGAGGGCSVLGRAGWVVRMRSEEGPSPRTLPSGSMGNAQGCCPQKSSPAHGSGVCADRWRLTWSVDYVRSRTRAVTQPPGCPHCALYPSFVGSLSPSAFPLSLVRVDKKIPRRGPLVPRFSQCTPSSAADSSSAGCLYIAGFGRSPLTSRRCHEMGLLVTQSSLSPTGRGQGPRAPHCAGPTGPRILPFPLVPHVCCRMFPYGWVLPYVYGTRRSLPWNLFFPAPLGHGLVTYTAGSFPEPTVLGCTEITPVR